MVRFLHAADLHLGLRITRFEEDAGFRRGSGNAIPNSGRVADSRPGMEAPGQCYSGLAEVGACLAGPKSSQLDETERFPASSA